MTQLPNYAITKFPLRNYQISSRLPGRRLRSPSITQLRNYSITKSSLSNHRQLTDNRRRIKRTRPSLKVRLELASPLVHDRYGGDGGGVAQWAESSPQHVLREVPDVVDVLLQSCSGVEAGQRLLEPVRPFAAWDAPSAAFVLVELHDAQREFHHAGLLVEHDDAA